MSPEFFRHGYKKYSAEEAIMAVILIGMMFGLVCVMGTVLTADPSMTQMLIIYAFAGNLGCAFQFMLSWYAARQQSPAPFA